MIQEAARFATKAHEGMLRKGGKMPYIYHPLEVALLVSRMTKDEEVIAAGYLHDVLEDTAVTEEELEQAFGRRVLELVKAETEDKSLTWEERKAHTIRHLEEAPYEVKLLTLADKLSNIRATAQDYLFMGDELWNRFNEKRRESHKWYAKGILDGMQDLEQYPEYQEYKELYQFVFGA